MPSPRGWLELEPLPAAYSSTRCDTPDTYHTHIHPHTGRCLSETEGPVNSDRVTERSTQTDGMRPTQDSTLFPSLFSFLLPGKLVSDGGPNKANRGLWPDS